MVSANLDLQDLNTLLTSYTKEYRELEKYIGYLTLVTLRISETASKVDPDIIKMRSIYATYNREGRSECR